jgi:hypothetical protein
LIVTGLEIWSLSNPGFEPGTFRSLAQMEKEKEGKSGDMGGEVSPKKGEEENCKN